MNNYQFRCADCGDWVESAIECEVGLCPTCTRRIDESILNWKNETETTDTETSP